MKITFLITDAMLLAGAGGLVYGAWMLDPAAGFLTGGGLLLAGGLFRGMVEARSGTKRKQE